MLFNDVHTYNSIAMNLALENNTIKLHFHQKMILNITYF